MNTRKIEQLNMISKFYKLFNLFFINKNSLVQKYKNRIKELDNSQKIQIAAFPKNKNIEKLFNRHASKISNIMHEADSNN